MLGFRRLIVAVLAAITGGGGCAGLFAPANSGFVDLEQPKSSDLKNASSKTTLYPTGDPAIAAVSDRTLTPPGSGFPPLASTPNNAGNPQDLAALAAEMQSLGTIPPAEQQALLEDLKQSDPVLWPQLVRQFRAAIAYRRGQGPRGTGQEGEPRGDIASATAFNSATIGTISDATERGNPASAEVVDENGAASVAASNKTSANKRPKVVAASGEALPGDPPLRPALKAGDRKSADQVAATKSIDTGATKSAGKGAAESSSQQPEEWQFQLTKAILAMEGESAGSSSTAVEISRQVQLRLLYLTAGRRDDALRPIPGLSAAQQEFWTKEIYGLVTYLDSERVTDPERRATEAALHLRDAAARIGELASPAVRNMAFCKEVTSFGVYKKFSKYEFKPGDEALLYCEIENLKAESTDKGFHTSVKSSYQILDARGERVADQEFPASEDFCASPRRDFFIPYFIWIPKRINDGTYTLQLTIEDTQTKKIGQSSIQFKVGTGG